MKTEISRNSHQPDNRYSGVYQQQGRMLTDADWNEMVDILKDSLNSALKNVIGSESGSLGGTPRHKGLRVRFTIHKVTGQKYLAIYPGSIYIDGMAAQYPGVGVVPFVDQDDLPDVPAPTGDYVLYADVWERTVTHFMDQDLRDKGLHGADTCTRKQKMVQIKWCTKDIDPEDIQDNPKKGNAPLNLSLHSKTTQLDPCDPCADTVDVATNVGNYLFRVEVHDVKETNGVATELTLKWSVENGAEHYSLTDGTTTQLPADFTSGKWAYEFFTDESEKHLGVNFASNGSIFPARGKLFHEFPAAIPAGYDYVRRWDGYVVINLTAKSISGFERTQPLTLTLTDETTDKVTGSAKLDTSFTAILSLLELELALDKKRFVTGDYWLADVREAEHQTDEIIVENKLPEGIEHYYLKLGQVSANNLNPEPERDRKYAFPSLTEMTRLFIAGGDGQEITPNQALQQPLRVGVANGEWPVEGATVRFVIDEGNGVLNPVNSGLTDAEGIAQCNWTPKTDVLSAMNAKFSVKATLVDPDAPSDSNKDIIPPVYFYANLVTADQVAYQPGCANTGEHTVHSLLADDANVPLDLGVDQYYTVEEVLNALLCHLKADHIPFNALTNPDRWDDILEVDNSPDRPLTVQSAIDTLITNLHSEDIKYPVPDCTPKTNTLISNLLAGNYIAHDTEDPVGIYRLNELWNALLCNLDASNIPYNSTTGSGSLLDGFVDVTGDTMTGALIIQDKLIVDDNIGIGTSQNPAAKLAVNGGVHVGGESDPGDNNLQVDGDVIIEGNLTVNGTTTTVNTEQMTVDDPVITLNHYDTNAANTSDSGIEVFRGPDIKALITWNEGFDRWEYGTEGNMKPIGSGGQELFTGLVTFENMPVNAEMATDWIDTGLGPGKLSIVLGHWPVPGNSFCIIADNDTSYRDFVYRTVVSTLTGQIMVYAKRISGSGKVTRQVQWWAMRPNEEKPDDLVSFGITITPTSATLIPNATRQFTATVTGVMNKGVAWSVQEGQTGGSVSQTGFYTAPSATGTYHVVATSNADSNTFAVATVNVILIKNKETKEIKEKDVKEKEFKEVKEKEKEVKEFKEKDKDLVDGFEKAIEVGEKTIEVGEKAIEVGDKAIEVGEKAIEVGDKAIEVGDKAIEVGDKAIEVGDKAIEVGEKAVEVGDKAIEVGGKVAEGFERPTDIVTPLADNSNQPSDARSLAPKETTAEQTEAKGKGKKKKGKTFIKSDERPDLSRPPKKEE